MSFLLDTNRVWRSSVGRVFVTTLTRAPTTREQLSNYLIGLWVREYQEKLPLIVEV